MKDISKSQALVTPAELLFFHDVLGSPSHQQVKQKFSWCSECLWFWTMTQWETSLKGISFFFLTRTSATYCCDKLTYEPARFMLSVGRSPLPLPDSRKLVGGLLVVRVPNAVIASSTNWDNCCRSSWWCRDKKKKEGKGRGERTGRGIE